MIVSVRIFDLAQTWNFARQINSHNFSAWIVALDPSDQKSAKQLQQTLELTGLKVLRLHFNDERSTDTSTNPLDPSTKDVLAIVKFLKDLTKTTEYHHLAINCFAGYSRSPAIAAIAFQEMGYSPQESLELVTQIRPISNPNPRILKIYQELREDCSQKSILSKDHQGGLLQPPCSQ